MVVFLSDRIRSNRNGMSSSGGCGCVVAAAAVAAVVLVAVVDGMRWGLNQDDGASTDEDRVVVNRIWVMCGKVVVIMVWMQVFMCGFVTACFPPT